MGAEVTQSSYKSITFCSFWQPCVWLCPINCQAGFKDWAMVPEWIAGKVEAAPVLCEEAELAAPYRGSGMALALANSPHRWVSDLRSPREIRNYLSRAASERRATVYRPNAPRRGRRLILRRLLYSRWKEQSAHELRIAVIHWGWNHTPNRAVPMQGQVV